MFNYSKCCLTRNFVTLAGGPPDLLRGAAHRGPPDHERHGHHPGLQAFRCGIPSRRPSPPQTLERPRSLRPVLNSASTVSTSSGFLACSFVFMHAWSGSVGPSPTVGLSGLVPLARRPWRGAGPSGSFLIYFHLFFHLFLQNGSSQ